MIDHLYHVRCSKGPFGLLRSMLGPKYNGKYLHRVVKELLGDTRLDQTLKNVVIPTFDIKLLQPAIFSTYDVCEEHNRRASLSSHAPTLVHAACDDLDYLIT